MAPATRTQRLAPALLALAALTALAGGARAAVLKPEPGSPPGVTRYTFNITTGNLDPDCKVKRKVLAINGLFQPTIEVAQGDRLEVLVINNIPASWPDVVNKGGISVHWHGFRMQANPWFDGTAWIAQCPILRGSSYLYNFTVDEPEGTYFYHDHAAYNRNDGLQGALIVRPPGYKVGGPPPANEQVLLLQDWWHYQGASMGMRLNRPFDPTKVTETSGEWCWIGLPRSLLINGRGVFDDCEDVYAREVNKTMANGAVATASDVISPTTCVAGQLGGAAAWPTCAPGADKAAAGCRRAEVVVAPGSTTLLRVVNAAALVYMTVCFGGHQVTALTADSRALAPRVFEDGCVDINSGQRMDLQLKADKAPGAYWISVTSQYRKGAPSAFGVLRYKDSPPGLPKGPVVQPEEGWQRRWDDTKTVSLKQRASESSVPKTITRRFFVHTTQPIMPNGLVRWALNNLATAETPKCGALTQELYRQPKLMANPQIQITPKSSDAAYWPNTTLGGDGRSGVRVLELNGPQNQTLVEGNTPLAGLHLMTLKLGEAVEIILQNNRAGAFGGEYNTTSPLTSARNGREQHPFHIHGGHFYIVGMGLGQWSEANVSSYNLVDPPLRDTATVLFDPAGPAAGWTAVRFKATNPGVWPLHCHILPHHIMGQAVNIVVEPEKALPPPANPPSCPKFCNYQFARFTTPLTKAAFGANPLLAPAMENGSPRRLLARVRKLLRL